ncbi:HGGxSTG domain-containing protein [Solemya velum gill symbiont]|uniref:HGGxSTG domain-containing protein n=1 Tax=Solemya velum gill symbiont TaxID=2340 RepID=UPI0009983D4A|nr:HGGxSTG domain-containing protein [Solemya velum gill symbiont]
MVRCGANTRQGHPCGHFAMKNGRCRYHGGKNTGAINPKIKHGYHTKASLQFRKLVSKILRSTKLQ